MWNKNTCSHWSGTTAGESSFFSSLGSAAVKFELAAAVKYSLSSPEGLVTEKEAVAAKEAAAAKADVYKIWNFKISESILECFEG